MSVSSGSIDNLYLIPDGTICIVETKLWRNPEAHRTVLAQIIGYAKSLSALSFDEFCQAATKEKAESAVSSFFIKIKSRYKDFNQEELQSKITESLTNGRFLLLIVGDKIFPEVVLLKEAIGSAPNLEFNIHLIELRFYSLEKNPDQLLVIPQLVGRTVEKVRAVVKIRYEQKRPEIDVTSIESSDVSKTGKTTKKEFLSSMPSDFADKLLPYIEDWAKKGFIFYWGTQGFSLRLLFQGKPKTIFDMYPTSLSVLSNKRCKSGNLPEQVCARYQDSVKDIPAINRCISENRVYVYYKDISVDEFGKLLSVMDKVLSELVELYKNNSLG